MPNFKGFTDTESFTQLPDTFFHRLLNEIEDVAELKVTSYFLWRVQNMEGPFRALCETDFISKDLGLSPDEIQRGLREAVQRGSILMVQKEAQEYFVLNSPRGRAAVEAIQTGKWSPENGMAAAPIERPNIFKLYEENIGPLTPLIADALKDAESIYSSEWISNAIELAAKNNKRNWKYIEVILKRWKEDGRAKKQDRRDDPQSRQRDVEDKIKKFVGR